jgi:hypothetical protein
MGPLVGAAADATGRTHPVSLTACPACCGVRSTWNFRQTGRRLSVSRETCKARPRRQIRYSADSFHVERGVYVTLSSLTKSAIVRLDS